MRRPATLSALLLLACSATPPPARAPAPTAQHHSPADRGSDHDREPSATHVEFKDPKRWTKHFDGPKRDRWQKPDQVIAALRLTGSERVADIGAGTGYFSLRLARALSSGQVFAIELEQTMLDFIGDRAEKAGLKNIELVRGEKDDPNLPEGLNMVLLVNTYHHISDRVKYFQGVKRHLAPGARLVIVDFRMGKLPVGPKDPHKMSRHQVLRELARAGYELCRQDDSLPYQYLLVTSPDCATGAADKSE